MRHHSALLALAEHGPRPATTHQPATTWPNVTAERAARDALALGASPERAHEVYVTAYGTTSLVPRVRA